MEKTSFIKVLFSYIKQHIKGIFLFIIFSGIFFVVLTLYNIKAYAVGYSVVLCCFTGFIFVMVDFLFYYTRHKKLLELQKKIMLSIDELPNPHNLTEKDYTDLIEIVHNDKVSYIYAYDNQKSEMEDYYTLWAHQIKTPISAMRLLLQSQDSEQNTQLSLELLKIEQYVSMVLSYLRLKSNTTDFVIKKYSIEDIVRQAIRKQAQIFIGKKINLDLHSLDVTVLTDEKWLLFVIEQLLSNALKYTKKGKISIYMEDNYTLVIKDTGIGIAKDDLPRICEKGFTGYNGRSDKKATGIGLYLCKRILLKLSHTIKIESEVGVGTKVMIGLDTDNIDIE